MSAEIVHHYPPELLKLLVDTIPLLCPSKRDVLVFFKGAGVSATITADLAQKVATARDSVNKYEIVREVLVRLNDKGEATLRERRLAWATLSAVSTAGHVFLSAPGEETVVIPRRAFEDEGDMLTVATWVNQWAKDASDGEPPA